MNGFTLLETMVAMVVAAALLAVLYGLFGKNITAVDGAEADARAVLLAQSCLEGIGIAHPLRAGTSRGGTDDGYAWVEEVRLDDGAALDPKAPLIPFAVKVTVSWSSERGTRSLSLDSVRLAAAP